MFGSFKCGFGGVVMSWVIHCDRPHYTFHWPLFNFARCQILVHLGMLPSTFMDLKHAITSIEIGHSGLPSIDIQIMPCFLIV